MRNFNEAFQAAIINADSADIRFTIEVQWDHDGTQLVYFLSHDDSGAPDGADTIHSINSIDSTSQALNNRYAIAEIGSLSFMLADVGNAITAELSSRFDDDLTAVQKKCTVYMGTVDLDWADYEPVDTWFIDDVDHTGPGYKFRGSDVQRLLRQKIITLDKSRLSKSMTASQQHIPLTLALSSPKFQAIVHDSAYTFNPSVTVGYLKIDDEVIAHDGTFFDHSSDGPSLGVISGGRGALNTVAAAHSTDAAATEDSGKEVIEVFYIEAKVVDVIHLVMTGQNVANTATIPDHWNAGIDTDFIDDDSFSAINTELSARRLRFIGEEEQDAKQFVEQQCMRFFGLFQTVTSQGKLKLNRYQRTIQESAPSAYVDGNTLISIGDLSQRAQDVINVYSINYNFDHLSKRCTRGLTYLDSSSYGSNGRTIKSETFEFRGVHTALHSDNDIRNFIYQTRELYSNPPFKTQIKVSRELLALEVGDVINVESSVRKDYVSGSTTLNRPFMITRRSLDLRSGEPTLELIGTGLKAESVLDPDAVGSLGELNDSFLTGTGTNLESLAEVTGGIVTSNLTLSGNADVNNAAAIWYVDGDLIIPNGVTLTITDNVQIRATGEIAVQNGGKIDGKGNGLVGAAFGDTATAGYFGTSKAGVGEEQAPTVYWYQDFNFGIIKKLPDLAPLIGSVQSIPFFNLRNEDGVLTGLPNDLRGTPGGPGGLALGDNPGNGGDGGNSGAGLITISRGFTVEAGGIVDLSGDDGTSGDDQDKTYPSGIVTMYAGGGAGGCPGGWLCITDGDFTAPTSDKLTANRGDSPWPSPRPHNRSGFIDTSLSGAAFRVQYVPSNKTIADDGTTGKRQLSAPTGLELTGGNSTLLEKADGSIEERVLATWDASTDANVIGYQVQAKRSSDSDWITVGLTSGADDVSLYFSSEGGVDYDVRVRAFSSAPDRIIASAWTTETNFTAEGKDAAPDDVPWFTIEGSTLKWGEVANIDLAGYEIRIRIGDNRQWIGATPLHSGLLTSSPYAAPALPGGTHTIMIKAKDQSGNESDNAAVIVTNIGEADFSNIVVSVDHHELGFPYTKVNGTVDGITGDLEAAASSDFYSSDEESALYSLDSAADFYPAALYSAMSYTWVYDVDELDIGADITIEYTISGTFSIYYRPYYPDLFFTGIDSNTVFTGDDDTLVFGDPQDWIIWPGILAATYGAYEFQILTEFSSTQSIVSDLTMIIDVPDVIEEFEDLIVSSSGTRLPITKTYRSIKTVLLTLQADGGTAVEARVIDKDEVQGPMINCRNSSQVLTSGTVDARVRGY